MRISITAALVAGLFLATGAQAQHLDALVFEDGGKVQMGFIDVDCFSGVGAPGCNPNGVLGNVYEAELLEVGVGPMTGFADEPGFFAVPSGSEGNLPYGNSLPGNAAHSIDLILAPNSPVPGQSILFWDGTGGSVTWSAVPNSEFFEIEGNNGSGFLTSTSVLSGVELDSTSTSGFFDTHPDFILNGGGGTDPTVGFYALFGITNIDGLVSSDPWGVVFDFGVEDEELHELAVESLASVVPEPGTGILLGLGLIGLGVNGRRRRA